MRKLVLDSQVLNAISSCPYRYNLTFEGLLAPQVLSGKLESGDLLHTTFKVFYTLRIRRPDLTYKRTIELALAYGLEHAKTLEQIQEDSDEILYHAREYFIFTEGEMWVPKYVEQPFARVIYESEEENLQLVYEGIVDLIVDSEYGELGVDHKKSSRRLNFNGLLLANQFKGYTRCLGFVGNRFVVNEVGTQKSLTCKERFKRHLLEYPQEILDEWLTTTIYYGQMLAFYLENDTWPQNFTSCKSTPDGQYQIDCQYQPACIAPVGEQREFELATRFKVNEKRWNPHERDIEFDQRLEELILGA